jgi:hypothetical protein
MKKLLFIIIFPVSVLLSFCGEPARTEAGSGSATSPETEAIIEVMNYSYVDGIQNLKGAEAIRPGFWEDFEMFMLVEGRIQLLPLEQWIERVEDQRSQNLQHEHPVRANYLDIHVTGRAASVALELWRGENKLFTDYFQLYKFDDGWKIVSKIFHRH